MHRRSSLSPLEIEDKTHVPLSPVHLLYPEGVRKGLPEVIHPLGVTGVQVRRLSPLVKAMHLYPYTPLGYGVRARGKGVRRRSFAFACASSLPRRGTQRIT